MPKSYFIRDLEYGLDVCPVTETTGQIVKHLEKSPLNLKAFTKHTLQYKVVSLERMYTQKTEMDLEVWIRIFVLTQHTHVHTHKCSK